MPAIPVRMVNEHVYCPRLAYLEWVQKEWADNSDTIQGSYAHRRVNKRSGPLPAPKHVEDDTKLHARSVDLESPKLGIVAKLDLIESDNGYVVPIEYKKGKRPHVPKGAYDPERVQLCAQGLILEEKGYLVEEGVLYFAESRERVRVVFDRELRALTLQAIDELKTSAASGQIPPPLEDSPKCGRCSLVSICMPDEINYLERGQDEIRPIAVPRPRALPVHVQSNGARVSKRGERLEVVTKDGDERSVRLNEISQLVLMGNVSVTAPTIHELMRRSIPVVWMSYGGWYLGHTASFSSGNVELRTAQYVGSFDERTCLELARGWVQAKIQNSRTVLMRNWRGGEQKARLARQLKQLSIRAADATSQRSLLGIEGAAASAYFSGFNDLLVENRLADGVFTMAGRNRRPPTDPVNAILSFVYAMLTRQMSIALVTTGFDEMRGFYHQPRYGRPALALDMMEPFRPLLADSVVLTVINNREVEARDFGRIGDGVNLNERGRKAVIGAFERRLDQEIKHPVFGYRVSYRRLLEIQSRLLARHLLGEVKQYPNFVTR